MGVFGSLVDSIKNKIEESSQRKKEEQLMLRRMQLEVDAERKRVFEDEYKHNAKIVAISKAKEQAAKQSGLQKMRAFNRSQRLQEHGSPPGSFFDKLGEYTQKNLARREENMKRTAEQRELAKKMLAERLQEQQSLRMERMSKTKPMGSKW